jgi:TolA-binding protein
MVIARFALIASFVLAASMALFATGDFYEESLPTLSDLLNSGQLPAKTMAEIVHGPEAKSTQLEEVDFRTEISKLGKLPPAEALKAVKKLLPGARAAQSTIGPGVTNLLHDLHDLFSSATAKPKEIADYIEWRLENTEWFAFAWGEKRQSRDSFNARPEADRASLEKRIAEASPALKPHWLYLRGAIAFKAGDDVEPEPWFRNVVAQFPKHPRAEAARFMIARCLLSQSRDVSDDKDAAPGFSYRSKTDERAEAARAFEDYVTRYPKGRFVGDALGWLGAAAYDAQDYPRALGYYLQQLELPDHPEFAQPASDMCEKVLSHLASAPDDAAFGEVAKTPSTALGLMYLILNTSESDNFNGEYDDPAEVQKWRREILPRVAHAIAAQEALYRDATWRPRHLAMLVLAASGAGNQEEAIRLASLVNDASSDDLLFARGLAMQRAKRSAEAVNAFQELLRQFPQSALAPETRLRLTLALCDEHRAGEAIVELLRAMPKKDDEEYWEPYGAILTQLAPGHFRQLADTVLNFAPTAELIAGAETAGLDPEMRLSITEALAQRLLAKEQFEAARKYVAEGAWTGAVAKVAVLADAVKKSRTPAEKASTCLALGDAWAAARGQVLTLPLDGEERRREIFADDHARADVQRAANAQALANAGNFNLELENRDELRHAFNWWIAASDALPKSPLAAQALWRALEVMPAIADVSPFHYERAIAKNWGDISHKLYDRLRREHPSSNEAKRLAVYWDFPPPRGHDPNEGPSDDVRSDSPRGTLAKEHWSGFSTSENAKQDSVRNKALMREILGLEESVKTSNAAKMKSLTIDLQNRARRELTDNEASFWVNHLDDLAQFFSGPDPGGEVRERYMELRARTLRLAAFEDWRMFAQPDGAMPDSDDALLKDIAQAIGDPKMKGAADFLGYLRCAVIANHIEDMPFPGVDKGGENYTYRSRNFSRLAKVSEEFLARFPRSAKREAALFLHAKALHYGMKPQVFDAGASWPEAPRWEGGPAPETTEQIPFNAVHLKSALDRCDKEFPNGRYASEVRNFRGALAVRMGDWKTALTTTLALLDDPTKPSLHEEAGERLADIFNHLAASAVRPDLLATINASARGRERLVEFIQGGGGNARFTYLAAWLQEQLR